MKSDFVHEIHFFRRAAGGLRVGWHVFARACFGAAARPGWASVLGPKPSPRAGARGGAVSLRGGDRSRLAAGSVAALAFRLLLKVAPSCPRGLATRNGWAWIPRTPGAGIPRTAVKGQASRELLGLASRALLSKGGHPETAVKGLASLNCCQRAGIPRTAVKGLASLNCW